MDGALVFLLLDGLAISWNSAQVSHSHSHQISECMTKHNYHASNSHEFTVNGEALQLRACSLHKAVFLLQVTPRSISVLQVKRESIWSTTSHVCPKCLWNGNCSSVLNNGIGSDLRATHSLRKHAPRLPSSCLHTHSSLTLPTLKYLLLPLCTDDVYSNMCGYLLLCWYSAITEMFFISRTAQHPCGLPVRRVFFQ